MEEGNGQAGREDIYSKAVKAGKRTYFFDVKTTRANDLYLTITESKKKFHDDGKFAYEKHKLFLYKEDFEKFIEGLNEAIQKISELKARGDFEETTLYNEETNGNRYTDVDFDDLDK
jgi:hypothetical protein